MIRSLVIALACLCLVGCISEPTQPKFKKRQMVIAREGFYEGTRGKVIEGNWWQAPSGFWRYRVVFDVEEDSVVESNVWVREEHLMAAPPCEEDSDEGQD